MPRNTISDSPTPPPDFGEPVRVQNNADAAHRVDDRHGRRQANCGTPEVAARYAACVNACRGMADPVGAVERMRTALADMVDSLRQIGNGRGLIAQHGDALAAGLTVLDEIPGDPERT